MYYIGDIFINMYSDLPLKKFLNALTIEEKKFIPHLASDKIGLILRSSINELDWYYYNLANTKNPTHEQQEQFYLLKLGVVRLIQLSLDSRESFDVPTVMFRREYGLTIHVLEIAAALGMIEHGRRVAQTVSMGIGQIEQITENEFLITLPETIPDDDYYERAINQHYVLEYRKWFAKVLRSDSMKKLEKEVDKKLYELVFPFETYYIGYGADPLLDNYFFDIANFELQLQEGFDTFHYKTRFGGIFYQHYVLALNFLMSNYFRHERFAEALIKKDSNIKLENILTISSNTDEFIESIQEAVNYFGSEFKDFEKINFMEARRIFEILSCSRKNTSILSTPGSPLPLIVQSSATGFIRCLTGAHSEPMRFLLKSLRYHFPTEYDKNQQTREKSLQNAIKRVLNEVLKELKYKENIKIKLEDKILTDIDLLVSEEQTGVIILCQLKHQELYGFDQKEQNTRTKRLQKQVKTWIDSLNYWRKVLGENGIRTALRLPNNFPTLSIYFLIISRHYCYSVKELITTDDTIYANWLQFVNAIELLKLKKTDIQLKDLIEILMKVKSEADNPQHYQPEPRSEWIINELKYTTIQENSETTIN